MYYAYVWYICCRKLAEAELKVAEKERGVAQAELNVLEKKKTQQIYNLRRLQGKALSWTDRFPAQLVYLHTHRFKCACVHTYIHACMHACTHKNMRSYSKHLISGWHTQLNDKTRCAAQLSAQLEFISNTSLGCSCFTPHVCALRPTQNYICRPPQHCSCQRFHHTCIHISHILTARYMHAHTHT